jgi:hypothetical protein
MRSCLDIKEVVLKTGLIEIIQQEFDVVSFCGIEHSFFISIDSKERSVSFQVNGITQVQLVILLVGKKSIHWISCICLRKGLLIIFD